MTCIFIMFYNVIVLSVQFMTLKPFENAKFVYLYFTSQGELILLSFKRLSRRTLGQEHSGMFF